MVKMQLYRSYQPHRTSLWSVCADLTELITHIAPQKKKKKKNHRASSVCLWIFESGIQCIMKRAGSPWQAPPPRVVCPLFMDVWLLLWIMKHDLLRSPTGHRWTGTKLPISASDVKGHLYCMSGHSCLDEVLARLALADCISAGLNEGLNGQTFLHMSGWDGCLLLTSQ